MKMRSLHRSPRAVTASTSPPVQYAYHCFVSYTTREQEVKAIKPCVDRLVDHLKKSGVVICPVFYDGWYLARRMYDVCELRERLACAIGKSAFTLAFVSPGYVDSPWCRFEWECTEHAHASRGTPAMEHSILPVLWKELPPFYWRGTKRCFRRKLEERMHWQGYFGVIPPKARAVDLCGRVTSVSVAGIGAASELLLAVQEYLERWYPTHDWISVSAEAL